MAGLKAAAGKIGYFVLGVALGCEEIHGVQVHIRLRVVVGDEGGVTVLPELCALLHLQAVAGNMLGSEKHRAGESVRPVLTALGGQTVDKVYADVLKACLSGGLESIQRLLVGVAAVYEFQYLVVCRLHTDGYAVEACAAKQPQLVLFDAVGVGLQRNLRVHQHLAAALERVEYFDEVLCAVPAGGAAAEVDGVDQIALKAGGVFLKMGDYSFLIGRDKVAAIFR